MLRKLSATVLMLVLALTLVTQTACGPDDLGKLNTTLNQVAHSLEAAIDTNGRLYESGIYGAKGSPEAIQLRQKVARVVHDSNEYLIKALELTKGLTKETFATGKLAVLQQLTLASQGLQVGNATIDLVLQSVVTLINQAVGIAQLFKASDVNNLRYILPKINTHIRALEHLRELNQLQ